MVSALHDEGRHPPFIKTVVADYEFAISAICAKYGMGPFKSLFEIPFEEQLAYFYVIAQSEGLKVEWSTGRVYRPKDP